MRHGNNMRTNNFESGAVYESPTIEICECAVEKGFAQSVYGLNAGNLEEEEW